MKRIIAIVCGVLAVFLLAGCSENTPEKDTAGENGPEVNETGGEESRGPVTVEQLLAHEVTPAEEFGYYENADGCLVIDSYLGEDPIVVIAEEYEGKPVCFIGALVFANHSPVQAIKLPDSLLRIEKSAFGLNESLQIVVCGKNLEYIGEAAFFGCSSLQEFHCQASALQTIDHFAFDSCSALQELTLPASVTHIDAAVFLCHAEDFVLRGEAGSYVETYAGEQGIPFEAIQ